jgi:hypothetical protein
MAMTIKEDERRSASDIIRVCAIPVQNGAYL